MKRGLFIVVDGTDGSGKSTQVKLLSERLHREGRASLVVDFPRYDVPSSYFARRYLNGEYGTLDEIGPRLASLFYALDRFDARSEIEQNLAKGVIVLSNRYVSANMGHQGAKIASAEERAKYFEWLHELEYEICGIPRPEVSILLHVPAEIGQQLVDQKGHRAYIAGAKRDLHEDNLEHLKAAEAAYLEIADRYPSFIKIECVENGAILSRAAIHELIWNRVKDRVQ